MSTLDPAAWQRHFEQYGSDTNGVSTGTFGDFPPEVVRSYFMNHTLKFNGSNYNLEVKRPDGQGLRAGTYRVSIISSIRSEVQTLNRGELNVKFGNGSNQLKYMYPQDNSNNPVVFTGQVQEGGTIRIAVHSYSSWSDLGLINGLIIEKID